MRLLTPTIVILLVAGLGACGQSSVNPPTEPAQPIVSPTATAAPDTASGTVAALPGTGPTSFVGRWAADVAWCVNRPGQAVGAQQPLEITPLRFEGYENSCFIASIDQTIDGYQAALQCVNEGQPRNERVTMKVTGQTLTLTYLDRGPAAQVNLLKCTTLADTSAKPAGLPVG